MTLPIVVLISGRGSNLAALIECAKRNQHYAIVGVISNRPDAPGLKRAADANIPTQTVDHTSFPNRERFEQALAEKIAAWSPQLIVLAGFMRVLSATFVQRFAGQIINVHPSLLPDFPGLNTHERALDSAVKLHGASVHYVTAELDGGPVVAQTRVEVLATDTAASLAARLLPKEHILLPTVVDWIAQRRVEWKQGTLFFDDQILSQPILVS